MKSRPKSALRFMRKYLGFLSDARRWELYPPFWFMGVKVAQMDEHFRHLRIKLPLTWRAKNMGGSMFGGYQASLADPIAALACAHLFKDYDVWTRHLSLDFRRPGTTDLELRFDFPPDLEATIREELQQKGRSNPHFQYGYYLANGKQCTWIECTVAIRPRGYAHHKGVGSAS